MNQAKTEACSEILQDEVGGSSDCGPRSHPETSSVLLESKNFLAPGGGGVVEDSFEPVNYVNDQLPCYSFKFDALYKGP